MTTPQTAKYKAPRDFEDDPQVAVKLSNSELAAQRIAQLEGEITKRDGEPEPSALEGMGREPSGFAKSVEEAESRYKNLQSLTQRQLNAAKQEVETSKARAEDFEGQNKVLREQLGKVQNGSMTVPTNAEELEQWKQDYPDFYNMLRPMVNAEGSAQAVQLTGDLESVTKERDDALERVAVLTKQSATAMLDAKHPDWKAVVTSDDFKEWLGNEPEEIQAMAAGYDGTKASRVVSMYKSSGRYKPSKAPKTPPNEAERQSQADAAASMPQGNPPVIGEGGKRVYKESEIAAMTDAQYDEAYDDIMIAQREGRFVADVGNMR